MDSEDSMFCFQMMNAMSSDWSRDDKTNEMYKCNQVTLSQLQDKVLRSLSKKYEKNNLQVVPQNDPVFENVSTSPFSRDSCAVRCCENRAKRKPITNVDTKYPRELTEQAEGLSYARKTPLLAIASCTTTEPLRTPTFPFSPLSKSPANFLAAPMSPLALMILSPFGKRPSEDLSIYLPENFTPAATLEHLENSITTTVFEFPSVEEDQANDKKINFKKEKHDDFDFEESLCCNDDVSVDTQNIHVADCYWKDSNSVCKKEVSFSEDHCSAVADEEEKDHNRKSSDGEPKASRCDVLRFRNRLERKRRSEMNSKYEKLRKCIPEIDEREKVAKITILKSAVECIQELRKQDRLLSKQKSIEKLRNEELLKKLVKISS